MKKRKRETKANFRKEPLSFMVAEWGSPDQSALVFVAGVSLAKGQHMNVASSGHSSSRNITTHHDDPAPPTSSVRPGTLLLHDGKYNADFTKVSFAPAELVCAGGSAFCKGIRCDISSKQPATMAASNEVHAHGENSIEDVLN